MTKDEIIKLTHASERETINIDMDQCLKMKKKLEDEYAEYILCRKPGPFTRWFLQKKDGKEVDLEIYDRLECIYTEKSFDYQSKYKGTIFSSIVEFSPDNIKLRLDDKTAYLMGEGSKIFSVHKPFLALEPETIMEQFKRLGQSIFKLIKRN